MTEDKIILGIPKLRQISLKVSNFNEDLTEDLANLKSNLTHLHGTSAMDLIKDIKKIKMRNEWEKRFK